VIRTHIDMDHEQEKDLRPLDCPFRQRKTQVQRFNVHGSGLKDANELISIRIMPQ